MNERVECRNVDHDAARSVLWWFRAELAGFLENPSAKVLFERGPRFAVSRAGQTLTIALPERFLDMRPAGPAQAFYRKALVRARLSRDPFPIDHYKVADFFRSVKREFSASLECPEAKTRFLLRVDDFPSPHADTKAFAKFHSIAVHHGISYLLGVTPFLERPNQKEMSREEIRLLMDCARSGAEVALHGFTHERADGTYPSEIAGKSEEQIDDAVQTALQFLAGAGFRPFAFIPPFNSIDSSAYSVFKRHFRIICGGPETTRTLGYKAGPSFLNDILYVPSYRGVYNPTAGDFRRLGYFDGASMVVPITLHWARDAKDRFRNFSKLAGKISGKTIRWNDLAESATPLMASAVRTAT